MGLRAIRVYELPVENATDVKETKAIFTRLQEKYGIKVLIGDWRACTPGSTSETPTTANWSRTTFNGWWTLLRRAVGARVATGNENNYHIRRGISERRSPWSRPNTTRHGQPGGAIRQELGNRHLMQFVALGQGELTEGRPS